jgi:8-oxo-dGTP pyrophosphatase MutT (NUDIX family)
MPPSGQEYQARPLDCRGYRWKYPRPVTNPRNPVNLGAMVREISAGGVVLQKVGEDWNLAVIEPQNEASSARPAGKSSQKTVLALPKGLVDPGEKPEHTALREVREETGLIATPISKLGDIKYVYLRSWGDRQRVFKIVSFFLLRYHSGDIDAIAPEMRVEVKRAAWIPLEEAARKLAYRGERDMVKRAQQYLKSHPEV